MSDFGPLTTSHPQTSCLFLVKSKQTKPDTPAPALLERFLPQRPGLHPQNDGLRDGNRRRSIDRQCRALDLSRRSPEARQTCRGRGLHDCASRERAARSERRRAANYPQRSERRNLARYQRSKKNTSSRNDTTVFRAGRNEKKRKRVRRGYRTLLLR